MRETKVNEIMGMIEDNSDPDRLMTIGAKKAPMGFYTWYRSDLIRETLREVPDEQSTKM